MAAATSNGPVPSKHVFIHELVKQDNNAKVRLLGCVLDYDDSTGRLTVEHNYPRSASPEIFTRAIIDVNIVLETTKMEILQPGSWINVIGYVQHGPLQRSRRSNSGRVRTVDSLEKVQAVLVWSAGAVRVEEYEKTLEDHLSVSSTR